MPCIDGRENEERDSLRTKVIELEKELCKSVGTNIDAYLAHRVGDLDYVIREAVKAGDIEVIRTLIDIGTNNFLLNRSLGNAICSKYLSQ